MSDTSCYGATSNAAGQGSYASGSTGDSSPLGITSSSLGDQAIPDLEPAYLDAFPLMKLSPELRLNVYDQLLIDLTLNRQRRVADLNKYHRAHEWPNNNFSAYLSMLPTCKEIHLHVRNLWENVYVHKCCFYFWKLPDFHRTVTSLVKLGEPYRNARYALRTRASDEIGLEEAEFITEEGETFMKEQPGFPSHNPDYVDFQWSWPDFPYASRSGLHTLNGHGPIPVETYRQGPKRRKYARAYFSGLEGCSLMVHDRQVSEHHAGTAYMLMSGEVGNVFWDKYDAAFGHGKQMIWDEWEKRGFPDNSLNRADIVLSQRAQLEAGMAAIWTRRAYRPQNLDDVNLMIEEVYSLSNWLRLRPAYAVG